MQPNEMKTKNVWTSGHEKVQVTSGEMMMQVLLNCLAGEFENCFVMTLREDLLLFGFVRTSGSPSLPSLSFSLWRILSSFLPEGARDIHPSQAGPGRFMERTIGILSSRERGSSCEERAV
jgi:hypothetical protein